LDEIGAADSNTEKGGMKEKEYFAMIDAVLKGKVRLV
jgi:hypothetical protein